MKANFLKFYLCFALAILSGSVQASSLDTPGDECVKFIQSLPTNAISGFVDVPEDWSDPKGKQLKIFYYGYHFHENPNASPLVYFNGGPGASAHGMDRYLAMKPDYLKVPFLFIDQRGTGCSSPLPLPEFTPEGVQHTALYGAHSIVLDAEELRKKVFKNKPWRIFGQSYGSFIVHRYIELEPGGIIAAFAHGGPIMTDGIEWTVNRSRAFKRVGDEYFKQFPDDRELINRARAIFPRNYCFENNVYQICGPALLDDLGWSNLSFKDFGYWEKLHEQIQQLLLPTGELNFEFIEKRFPQKGEDDFQTFMVDVVPAREVPGGSCNTWSCELAIDRMQKNGEKPMDYEFNECRNALAIHRKYDYSLIENVIEQDYTSLKKIDHHLKLHPKLQFFLYSGALDTFAPQESFAEEVALFGKNVNYRAYSSGHGAYFEEAQTWKDILSTQ